MAEVRHPRRPLTPGAANLGQGWKAPLTKVTITGMVPSLVGEHQAAPAPDARGAPAPFPWYLWAVLPIWAAAAIWSAHGGVAQVELEQYLPYHLSNAPFAAQLYNSRVLDQGMYQARELSYALDAIDCRFIAWSVRLGFPHFLSIVYFSCTLATALLLWRFLTGALALDRVAALLLIALYLTAPCVFFSTSYFRSAKASLTLGTMILCGLLYRGLKANHRRWTRWLIFGLVAFAATLCDRQGFFLVSVMAALLAIFSVLGRSLAAAAAALAAFAAAGLSLLYNYAIAPRLTLALNGYWPDFSYQTLPWRDFLATPAAYALAGLGLLLDTVRFLFGDFPAPFAPLLVAAVVLAIAWRHGRLCGILAGSFLLCLVAMNALMTLRHRAVLWEDVRRGAYFLPATLLLVTLAGIALAGLFRRPAPLALRVALAAALIGNIAALPSHRAILDAGDGSAGPGTARKAISAALRQALATGRPTPEVADDPIYRALSVGK